jgi:glycosyltransferase involved in cell wall biosynthesis
VRIQVSIVIPTMDRRELLSRAIESCLEQTYQELEVVVVDGGTDDTEAYVRGLNDPRLVYVRQPSGEGMMPAFNLGFSRARGEYLTWLSDDDLYFKNAIEVLADELDRDRKVDFVYAHYDKVDAHGKFLASGRVEDPDWLDRDNCIGHCFLYRRKIYEKLGAYRETPVLAEDYDYWLRVRAGFCMKRVPLVLGQHYIHPDGLTMIHGASEMAFAVECARRPFVPAWKHHFFVAERYYHAKSCFKAVGHICLSLVLWPFYRPSIRLLALLVLPAAVTSLVRSWRSARRTC